MAKKAKKQVVHPQNTQSRGGPNIWVVIVIFLALSAVILPTMLIVIVGMLPTVVAFYIDRAKKGRSWVCVGGMNVIGVSSYLLDLWFSSLGLDYAMSTITSVFSLITMYGMAAFGWMIYLSMPPVVGIFLSIVATTRSATLKASQRRLIDVWGPEVAGDSQHIEGMEDIQDLSELEDL